MLTSPKIAKAMHPADVLPLKGVLSIGRLQKTLQPRQILGLISSQLLYMTKILQLKNGLSPKQIEFISSQVYTLHTHLTLVDVHIIIKRAITGYYGELYQSMNPAKVLKWFSDYFQEKCQEAERQNWEQHVNVKESPHEDRVSVENKEQTAKKMREANIWYKKQQVKQ